MGSLPTGNPEDKEDIVSKCVFLVCNLCCHTGVVLLTLLTLLTEQTNLPVLV